MISIDEFKRLSQEVLGSDLDENSAQRNSVYHEGDDILMLVAGPGSGKTRVLVLRALRHVFVDDILPEHILITTFTRKAAKELRTRWLDWGTAFIDCIHQIPGTQEMMERIDLNRCRIDTLDSISQQALTENRLPNEVAPILLEGSASKLTLKRFSFGEIYRNNRDALDQFFSRYTFTQDVPRNQGEALSVAKTLCDRLVQDLVNLEPYGNDNLGNQTILEILSRYHNYLREANLFDFAYLERVFLERLQNDTLHIWLDEIEALLIDEYQDTNPLQEAIYFEIISKASPAVMVVGDDDQSMYRFRGGSVELFTQFGERCQEATGRQTNRIDMIVNYRSSNEIVQFYNRHITNDRNFAIARITPAKPEVISNKGYLGMPVLGLFRDNRQTLAHDLAEWLQTLYRDRSIVLGNNQQFTLNLRDSNDWGDFVFLAHSVEEVKYNRRDNSAEARFGGLFRNAMENNEFHVFNPRGRALRTIPHVQQLLGLLLLCLDPGNTLIDQVYPTNEARFFLNAWRDAANALITSDPIPSGSGGVRHFVNQWAQASQGRANDFPRDWPVLELVFTLITWIPEFQSDSEHQVWLEAVTRAVSSAGMASPYGMKILQNGVHRIRSRESFIRDALLPIAENEVDIDEDIMPSVPRNYLQFMTIHQSKGLEFPFVIVDVGSHFTTNHHTQKFLRFPDNESNVVRMEDDVEPFLRTPLRTNRTPIDRTFDDLVRLYYVAYSRPQSVLLLIGCENCLNYGRIGSLTDRAIPNVALGWNRDGSWPWRQPQTGRRRPIRVEPPLLLI